MQENNFFFTTGWAGWAKICLPGLYRILWVTQPLFPDLRETGFAEMAYADVF